MTYIEDILHILVDTIGIKDSDNAILTSISRQCKKGIALTDRQFELVKTKLQDNVELFSEYDFDFDNFQSRLPLREIDRSKYVKLVNTAEAYGNAPYESSKENWMWIKVRFPFSKKDIVAIESVTQMVSKRGRRREYMHNKGSHEHYFKYNAYTIYFIVNLLKNRSFEIDDSLIEVYNKVKELLENKQQYIPSVVDNKLINVHNDALNLIIEDVTDTQNELLLKDRSIRYGYFFNNYNNSGSLKDTVVCRDKPDVLINPDRYNINQIAEVVYELNRFPLVVIIDQENCCDQLLEIHKAFSYLVEDTQQSVLFRVDSNDGKNSYLNDYIRDQNLNNWVDKNTKIVYIKKNKLPKALLTSDFRPCAALGKTSMRNNAQVDTYINFHCDLIMYHDNQENLFGKFGRKYGILQTYY